VEGPSGSLHREAADRNRNVTCASRSSRPLLSSCPVFRARSSSTNGWVRISDPEYPGIVKDLEAEGLFRRSGDGSKPPPHIGAALGNIHGEMAKRTM
jgi:hypothetical protein